MRPAFAQDVKKKRKDIQVVRIVKDVMTKKRLFPRVFCVWRPDTKIY